MFSKDKNNYSKLKCKKKKDKIKDKDNEESDDIVEVKKREPVPHAMQDIEYWKRKYVIIKNLFY